MLIGFIWLRTYQYLRHGISSRTVLSKTDDMSMFKQLQPFTDNYLPICTVPHNQHHYENIKSHKQFLGHPRRPSRVINYWAVLTYVHNRTVQTKTFLSRSFAYCYCTVGTFPMRSGPRSENNATHSVCHRLSLSFKLLSHTLFLVHNTAPRASLPLSNKIPMHGHFKNCTERPSTRYVQRHI
jgi:hypothetical protein